MTNVIQLIEKVGRTSGLTALNYGEIVEQMDLADELKDALLKKDAEALKTLLGAGHNLMCILVPADDDDNDSSGDDDTQEEEIAV